MQTPKRNPRARSGPNAYRARMARLEVRWTGGDEDEIADALKGLGLQEVEIGYFVAGAKAERL